MNRNMRMFGLLLLVLLMTVVSMTVTVAQEGAPGPQEVVPTVVSPTTEVVEPAREDVVVSVDRSFFYVAIILAASLITSYLLYRSRPPQTPQELEAERQRQEADRRRFDELQSKLDDLTRDVGLTATPIDDLALTVAREVLRQLESRLLPRDPDGPQPPAASEPPGSTRL